MVIWTLVNKNTCHFTKNPYYIPIKLNLWGVLAMNSGETLRKIRNINGLSQSQRAQKAGVHMTNIARHETNKQTPTVDVLKRIADYYDVSIDYFTTETEELKPASKIRDKKLLEKFEKLEEFDDEEKKVVVELIDAFIAKHEMKRLVS